MTLNVTPEQKAELAADKARIAHLRAANRRLAARVMHLQRQLAQRNDDEDDDDAC